MQTILQRTTIGGISLPLIAKQHLRRLRLVFSGISFTHPSNH
jgi:hypothetical protein